MIEAKGDRLDGDAGKSKPKPGRRWQNLAASDCRYFMVYENKTLYREEAYTIDEFIDILNDL